MGTDADGEAAVSEYVSDGGPELLAARAKIAEFARSAVGPRLKAERLAAEAVLLAPQAAIGTWNSHVGRCSRNLRPLGSQSGFSRPVSVCKYSCSAQKPQQLQQQLLAVADWGGEISVLDSDTLSARAKRSVHRGQVSGLAWTQAATSKLLVSGGADHQAFCLDPNTLEPLLQFQGHTGRVATVSVHPGNRLAVTGSYDRTWRLWDLETGFPILSQDGHSRGIHASSFHCDGALLATAGLDGITRLWDLRTGQTVMLLDSHARECYAVEFSPGSTSIATAGGDGAVHVWSTRKPDNFEQIPAHVSTIVSLGWAQQEVLWSASHDGSAIAWNTATWRRERVISTSAKITNMDFTGDQLALCRFDRLVDVFVS